MKNRVLSLFLAVVLALGIMVPACADAVNDNPEYQDWSWRGVLDITNIHSISTTEDADGIPLEILHTTAPTTLTLRRDVEVPDLGTCVEKLVDGQWVVVPLTSGTETADGAISAGATYVLDAGTYYLFTANASHCIYIVVEEDSVLPQPPVPETFTDVANDAYYAEPVTWAVINGITSGMGDGLFAPDLPCTRAQIATFLWRTFGSPEPVSTSNPFSDVSPNAYYYKAVLWAVEEGITGGMGGGLFAPDLPCTRAQAVTFLYRSADASPVLSSGSFSDVAANSYYADAVEWAVANGITGGMGGGLFAPDLPCTRAQIVTFLFRHAILAPQEPPLGEEEEEDYPFLDPLDYDLTQYTRDLTTKGYGVYQLDYSSWEDYSVDGYVRNEAGELVDTMVITADGRVFFHVGGRDIWGTVYAYNGADPRPEGWPFWIIELNGLPYYGDMLQLELAVSNMPTVTSTNALGVTGLTTVWDFHWISANCDIFLPPDVSQEQVID